MTMNHTLATAQRLGADSHGVICAGDLRRAGVDPQDVERLVRDGRWQRLLKGIYLTHPGPAAWPARAHAAVLHAGPGSVLTGLLGAHWLGLRWLPRVSTAHVLVAPEARRRSTTAWVTVRRAADLSRVPTWSAFGLRVADPARLVVDAAREAGTLAQVRGIVLGALTDGWCSEGDLHELLDRGAVAGTALCRRAARDGGRGVASPPEAELVDALLTRRVPFWANPQLLLDGVLVGSPDVYLRGTGVCGELDSEEFHSERDLLDLTLERDRRFTRSGLWIEHVTPRRFRADPSAYVDRLLTSARARRTSSEADEPAGLVVVPRGPLLGGT